MEALYYLNRKFLVSFNVKNNNEYVSVIKQFLKSSVKLEGFLSTIPDEYGLIDVRNENFVRKLNNIDKKILVTNFFVNAIIKMLIYDFRNIILKLLKE